MNKEYLIELLAENQFFHYENSFEPLKSRDIQKSHHYSAIQEMYQEELGGLQDSLPLLTPSWDIEIKDLRLVIQIGNVLDYNRFRSRTFRSELYKHLPYLATDKLLLTCQRQERNCIKAGTIGEQWADAFSELHFGKSEEIGDLGGNGSAKWKMRAFQNFLVDITPLFKNYKILRLNPYDSLLIQGKIVKLEDLALSRTAQNKKYLMNYLLRQFSNMEG
ncbi:MAG: hypothetical protein GY827_12850 [Cytophagales bacterium]|nr:hypothetical protein [Cytophagales bacterium]